MSKPRHTRQVRLAEIGDEGQARIVATTAVVDGEGLAGTIEARYLAGAGVGKIATGNQSIAEAARAVDSTVQIVPPSPNRLGLGAAPPFGVRDPTALEVATGAWRALAHIRRAVRAVSATDGEA
jgi:hypothetical protein